MSDFEVDVLAVGPHPDDVELFCGGVMIRMADLGHTTAVLDLTEGERATNGDVETRREETRAASRVLGLDHRENLGLPDTGLSPWMDGGAQVVRVVEALRRLRPELVLVPWTRARHPDHAAAGELVTRALFFAGVAKFEAEGAPFRPRRALYYALRHTFRPSFVVDTTEAAERKRAAIDCYRSQVAPSGASTLVGAHGSVAAIDARDRFYGSMIGVEHAEPLKSSTALGIADPLEHFREHDYPNAFVVEDEP